MDRRVSSLIFSLLAKSLPVKVHRDSRVQLSWSDLPSADFSIFSQWLLQHLFVRKWRVIAEATISWIASCCVVCSIWVMHRWCVRSPGVGRRRAGVRACGRRAAELPTRGRPGRGTLATDCSACGINNQSHAPKTSSIFSSGWELEQR